MTFKAEHNQIEHELSSINSSDAIRASFRSQMTQKNVSNLDMIGTEQTSLDHIKHSTKNENSKPLSDIHAHDNMSMIEERKTKPIDFNPNQSSIKIRTMEHNEYMEDSLLQQVEIAKYELQQNQSSNQQSQSFNSKKS